MATCSLGDTANGLLLPSFIHTDILAKYHTQRWNHFHGKATNTLVLYTIPVKDMTRDRNETLLALRCLRATCQLCYQCDHPVTKMQSLCVLHGMFKTKWLKKREKKTTQPTAVPPGLCRSAVP